MPGSTNVNTVAFARITGGKVKVERVFALFFWLTRKEMLVVKLSTPCNPAWIMPRAMFFLTSNLACLVFQQLDNQLNLAVFPTVLSPLPPPKSVAAESGKNSNILSVVRTVIF